MAVYKDSVVYEEPATYEVEPSGDVITVLSPTRGGGYATIGVAQAVDFGGSSVDNRADSMSVMVKPGDEFQVTAKILDGLLGLSPEGEEHAVVTTVHQLIRLRDLIVSKKGDEVCLVVKLALNDLIDMLNGQVAVSISYTKEEVQAALDGPVPAHS